VERRGAGIWLRAAVCLALEECGAYQEAERWGREAVERNPGDLWAIHSVAHVLEMQGRSAEGVKWLNYTPDQWAKKNPFKAHVWWHAALFFLAQGEYERALSLYDNEICSVNSETYVDVSNRAALLKRLEMSGVDIGERWKELSEHSEKRIHDHMLPFRDAHFCLALAANGNFDAARRHIGSMAAFAARSEVAGGSAEERPPFPV
jgi:tetratricopeptide (TPR) repeat protein